MESIDAMNLGAIARKKLNILVILLMAALAFAIVPQAAIAQDEADTTLTEAAVAEPLETTVTDAEAPDFDYYGPEMILGEPENGAFGFQDQYTADGEYGLWMHDAILLPIITVISLFVLGLLLWVVVRYNKRSNTVPSKTSHNTLIEVVWTVIPVLILVVIAVPSITLLARQYQTPPEDAITIKANGYQWYWGYEYVDNGGFEVISNMMPESDALAAGLPPQLAVDNRMVVPVGVPIRLQTFGADVIHSFGIPSLWFKLDAVPGRINERMLTIDEPGIYYGQCMELCGARHGYMPIAIEARPLDEYNAWVQTQPGGMTVAQIEAQEAAAAAPAATDDDIEGVRPPVSSEEGAPIAGEPPTDDTSPTT
ncbi:cytochrome c oxidase subunit II [Aurantiacibacter poecillastricola]|uniref:cytochrome c oxidase subunit II n=1 Tax=Aurantiacibacter poecillastricola TaxID=3064385 RepID=UPI00273D6986|nr:cytochrome c oxidase subunit II [Aurantiacibacter sp. 219JJ12-13]MDP5261474.1 cytochrome c oxidase subunit II [Aurantiacibacter sp. 219JJ12-13]